MNRLPDTSCSEPLDPETFRQHLLLLKSAHCARAVQYQGKNQFISGLTMNRGGGRWEMDVYLAGIHGAIDSAAITIKTTNNEGDGNGKDN